MKNLILASVFILGVGCVPPSGVGQIGLNVKSLSPKVIVGFFNVFEVREEEIG